MFGAMNARPAMSGARAGGSRPRQLIPARSAAEKQPLPRGVTGSWMLTRLLPPTLQKELVSPGRSLQGRGRDPSGSVAVRGGCPRQQTGQRHSLCTGRGKADREPRAPSHHSRLAGENLTY